jgi:hypothetical protein
MDAITPPDGVEEPAPAPQSDIPTPPGGTAPLTPPRGSASAEPAAAAARSAPPLSVQAAPGKMPASAADGWHLRTSAGESGPHPLSGVRDRIRKEELFAHDEVLLPGQTHWVKAGDAPDLKRYFALKAKTAPGPSPAGAPPEVTCRNHANARADWLCNTCPATYCPVCVMVRDIGTVRGVRTCPTCANACQPIAHPKVVVPFWTDIPALLAYPVRGLAWIAIVLCSLATGGAFLASYAGLYGGGGAFILTMSIYAYHLYILRKSARGDTRLPSLGDVENIITDLVVPGLKSFVVSLVVVIPMAFYARVYLIPAAIDVAMADPEGVLEMVVPEGLGDRAAEGEDDEAPPPGMTAEQQEAYQAFQDLQAPFQAEADEEEEDAEEPEWTPSDTSVLSEEDEPDRGPAAWRWLVVHVLVFLLLCVYAVVVLPILLIIVAQFNTIAPAFNPPLILRILAEIKKEYALCVAFVAVAYFVSLAVSAVLGILGAVGIVAGTLFGYYCSFIAFHVMGRTAELADQKIDWY